MCVDVLRNITIQDIEDGEEENGIVSLMETWIDV